MVPKKSATATTKTLLKAGLCKSKKYIDTESESEIDDSKIEFTHNSNKNKFEKTKTPPVQAKKAPLIQKEAFKKVSKTKHYTDSNSDDTDTSLILDLPKSGKNSPSLPTLTPQKPKLKQNVNSVKTVQTSKTNKSKGETRKFRSSSIESIDSLDSDSADSNASIEQKMKKIRSKKGQTTAPKVRPYQV